MVPPPDIPPADLPDAPRPQRDPQAAIDLGRGNRGGENGLDRCRDAQQSWCVAGRSDDLCADGSPSVVVPHGIADRWVAETLNACVHRSMTLRTGSSDPPILTVGTADFRRRNRQCREEAVRRLLERRIDLAPDHLPPTIARA